MGLLYVPVPTDIGFVSSSVAETEYSAWSSAASYTVGQRVIFAHRQYYCKANVGPTLAIPSQDTAHWTDAEASNQRKPFDYFNTKRFSATNPNWVVSPPLPADTISIWSTICQSVTVNVVYGGNVIQNDTYPMLINDTAYDYMSWILAVPEPLLDRSMPLNFLPGATVTVTLNGSSVVGKITFGQAADWGLATWDTSLAQRGYSKIEEDEFGVLGVTPRDSTFDIKFRVVIDPDKVQMVKRKVKDAEGIVAAYIATDDTPGTREAIFGAMALGIKTSFDLDYGTSGQSNYALSVRGIN